MTSDPVLHWDDARTWRGERGHIAGTWQSLTGRASRTVGVKRIQVDPGMWSTPLHLEGAEEEIFYVLGGSGVSVQWEGEDDPRATRCGRATASSTSRSRTRTRSRPARRARRARVRPAHATRPASPGFRAPASPGSARPGRRSAPRRITLDARGRRRAPEVGELSPRPANIVNVADLEPVERDAETDRPPRPVPGPRGRLGADRDPPCRGLPGQAERTAALPRARGGDLRRARRRRPAAPLGGGRRRGAPRPRARSSCAPGEHGSRPRVPGRRGRDDACSCTGPASRATSATTRARARSTSSGSGSSPASASSSTTGTARIDESSLKEFRGEPGR